jgi:hypothetical protein
MSWGNGTYGDWLSLARPTFAWPGSRPVGSGSPWAFRAASHGGRLPAPHVPDGDRVEHYSGLSLTTPLKRLRVAPKNPPSDTAR